MSVPLTMFAWRKHKGNPEAIWEEVPVPKPGPKDVLIKLIASGVCHSDYSLLTFENQPGWFQEKFTLGHEGCGQIIQIGVDVANSKLKIGDIVALHSVPGCHEQDCPECSRELWQLCERGHHSGIGQDGFYAPYATIDARGVVLVPEGVSTAVAAVATDAVNTAYHAIHRRAEVKSYETVFLFGLGGLGFNALQLVLAIGARVIVSDVRHELLQAARELGVPERDIVPPEISPQQFVARENLKIDTVLDFVGKNQTFEDAQNIVRRGGKLLCVGTLNKENTLHMSIGTRKRLTLLFSYGGQAQDLKVVLDMIAKGLIRPQVETQRLADFPVVLRDLHEGKIKGRTVLLHDQ